MLHQSNNLRQLRRAYPVVPVNEKYLLKIAVRFITQITLLNMVPLRKHGAQTIQTGKQGDLRKKM